MSIIPAVRTLYSHLSCSKSGEYYDKNILQTFSRQNKPLVACYELDYPLDRSVLRARPQSMWRYREVLPVEQEENVISLNEGMTPLLTLPSLQDELDLGHLLLKDEAQNPTGSFKARGLSVAISKAREFGVQTCVIPTAGNAGGALSAYCAKAGIEAIVYMPEKTPDLFKKECMLFGARVVTVKGSIADCALKLKEDRQDHWFDVSTMKEPFRLEGKKTMGYEIAEQSDWELPDVILYPTGGGTGLIGIWKAFRELKKLNWLNTEHLPRMVVVQSLACDPIVQAWNAQLSSAPVFSNPKETIANGLRVPKAFGDEMILDVLRESNGAAVSMDDQQILEGIREVAQKEGILLSPEGAAVWKACRHLRQRDWIKKGEKVVMLNTGSLYKYMENI